MKNYVTSGKRLNLTPDEMKERVRLQRLAAVKRYAAKHPERVRKHLKAWRSKRAEHCTMYNAEAYRKNSSYYKAYVEKYRKLNLKKNRDYARLRYQRKMRVIPLWANRKLMKLMYDVAREMSRSEGIPYTVDHIIPLAGRNVSGLHVETNMQIVPASFNNKKKNKTPGEMLPMAGIL